MVLSVTIDGILPSFPNLIYLELGIESHFGWKLLPHVLNNSPNLQVLDLTKGSDDEFGLHDFAWYHSKSVPSCLSLHVKRIQIRDMIGEFDELYVVKYLLKNCEVLEKFVVKSRIPDFCRKQRMEDQVLTISKGFHPLRN